MSKTSIEWTQDTWNPIRGCSPVSPGCKNCYAERQAGRFCGPGKPFHGFVQIGKNGNSGPHWTGKVELIPKMLEIPLRRSEPTTWFVNSMSDLFHESLDDAAIVKVFCVMRDCPQHTFQVLTKRSERMHRFMMDWVTPICPTGIQPVDPPENVWLGVSAEDQERADERIPLLLQTPAAVRFVSLEPLLGTIDLLNLPDGLSALTGWKWTRDKCEIPRELRGIDWVIVGGESGPNARPCDVSWIRSILQQCQTAGINCFVKQLGSKPVGWGFPNVPDSEVARLKDRKGADMDEWPEDLCWREFPMSRRERV